MAPFDQEFYLIINLAVGGTIGYFPDDIDGKPWSNIGPRPMSDFWEAREDWMPTWDFKGTDSALQIKNLNVMELEKTGKLIPIPGTGPTGRLK